MTEDEFRVLEHIRTFPGLTGPQISKAINGLDQLQVLNIVESLEKRGFLFNHQPQWNGKYNCKHWRSIALNERVSNALRHMCNEMRTNQQQDFNPSDLLVAFNNELHESNIREIFELLHSRGFARIDFRTKDDPESIRLKDTACSAYERGEFIKTSTQSINITQVTDYSVKQNIIDSVIHGPVSQSSDSSRNKIESAPAKASTSIIKKIIVGVVIGVLAGLILYYVFKIPS